MSFAPPCDQFAEIWHGRKTGRPIECGPNMRSADVCHPFLGLGFGCGSRLCWKLEHCCFLTFKYVSQQHGLPVWKFQRIMMCSRVVLVDLPEDGRCMIDHMHAGVTSASKKRKHSSHLPLSRLASNAAISSPRHSQMTPDSTDSSHFMGYSEAPGGVMVSPR